MGSAMRASMKAASVTDHYSLIEPSRTRSRGLRSALRRAELFDAKVFAAQKLSELQRRGTHQIPREQQRTDHGVEVELDDVCFVDGVADAALHRFDQELVPVGLEHRAAEHDDRVGAAKHQRP